MSTTDERFLVTGALGCIGAWTCAVLAESGASVVGYDLGTDERRLLLAGAERVPVVRGDICDRAALDRLLDEHEITHVIHLAALLIPQIKADPPRGTAINVGGTVNILDAAKSRGIRVAYASSAAVYSQLDDTGGAVPNDTVGHPVTFYGVHKQACEGLARIFWQEEQVASIGIRPFIVYGPGRDSGLTASPSLAMAAAARGEDSQIAFGGRTQLQFAPDTARVFVAAARAASGGRARLQPRRPGRRRRRRCTRDRGGRERLVHGRRVDPAPVPRGVRQRRARGRRRADQLDAARRGCPPDDRPAASRAGLNDASTTTRIADAATSAASTASKPPVRSRRTPRRSGESADSV